MGGKRDNLYYLKIFGSLKKRASEIFFDMNRIFNKLYNNIPIDINPSPQANKVTYVRDFDVVFTMV
jgi:hypothetical protein